MCNKGGAWGQVRRLGRREELGYKGGARGQGRSSGTREEPGDKGGSWGQGRSLGTREEPGDKGGSNHNYAVFRDILVQLDPLPSP